MPPLPLRRVAAHRCAAARLGSPRLHGLVGPRGLQHQRADVRFPRAARVPFSTAGRRTATAASNALLPLYHQACMRGVFLRSKRSLPCVSASLSTYGVCPECVQLSARPPQSEHSCDAKRCAALSSDARSSYYPIISPSARTHSRQCPEGSTKPKVHPRREYSTDPALLLAVTSAPLATSSRTTSNLPSAAA